MKRRTFSLALLALPALSGRAAGLATPPEPQAVGAPYGTLDPSIDEDGRTVRLFFQFGCQFCRRAHEPLASWGATLPAPFEFRDTPVVTTAAASVVGAMSFYAVRRAAPGKLASFVAAVYTGIHDLGRSPQDPATFARSALEAGVPKDLFLKAVNSQEVARLVEAAASLAGRYKLVATPSLGVGGRYVVGTEVTEGVNQRFYNLANAVVSKYLMEKGWAPS